jgi:hypothetical protein
MKKQTSRFSNLTKHTKIENDLSEKLLKKEKFEGEIYPTTVRLPIELHAQFKAIVSKKKKKIGQVITELVRAYVEKELKK